MLAREYCDAIKREDKPIVLSHHMLSGLKEGALKMSKSDPDTAIFMEDSVEDVNKKIKKAYCPEKIVEGNPILDYCESIIFPAFGKYTINIRDQGPREFSSYEQLR